MGNCLKINSDDISLLRGSGTDNGSISDGNIRGGSISLANDRNPDFTTDVSSSTPPVYTEIMEPMFYSSMTSGPAIIQSYANRSNQHLQLGDEEQVRLAKRIGLIQHLPIGTFDGGTMKGTCIRECVICMIEFCINDPVRYLPCMHAYHVRCIDDWLMRSLTCPSCTVPVDAALLISFET